VIAGLKALDESSDEEGFSLLEPSRRMIEVNVIDTGIGIPEEERERIFDAFYQVDSSSTREHEGTGLGLSIVRRLVDAHGGTVRVSANQPTGAIFSVVLLAASQRNQLGGTPRRAPAERLVVRAARDRPRLRLSTVVLSFGDTSMRTRAPSGAFCSPGARSALRSAASPSARGARSMCGGCTRAVAHRLLEGDSSR
jgi:hypothetical protein